MTDPCHRCPRCGAPADRSLRLRRGRDQDGVREAARWPS